MQSDSNNQHRAPTAHTSSGGVRTIKPGHVGRAKPRTSMSGIPVCGVDTRLCCSGDPARSKSHLQLGAGDCADKPLQGRSNRPLALQSPPMGVRLIRLPVQPQKRQSAPGSLSHTASVGSEPLPQNTRQEKAATTVGSPGIVAVHASSGASAQAMPAVSTQTTHTSTTSHTTQQTSLQSIREIPESLSARLEELTMPLGTANNASTHPAMVPVADPSCLRRFKGGCLDPRVQVSLEPRATSTQRQATVRLLCS